MKIEMLGKKFGKLTVIEEAGQNKNGTFEYLCRCDCGNEIIVNGSSLRRGHSKTCHKKGCGLNKTHGLRFTEFYKKYHQMLYRCKRKDNELYHKRGITVCNEWKGKNGLINCYNWSLKNGYEEGKGLSLDRVDNEKGYEPSNCRWVNWYIQAENKRISAKNKTGVAGVYMRNGKYVTAITAKRKKIHLGTYETLQEAKEIRKQAELKYWGFTLIKD